MRSMLREDAALQPTARTLWEIQEKCCAFSAETATNLYTDVLRRAGPALEKGERRRAQVRDGASLRRYQQEVRALFLSCIGGLPEPGQTPARVTGRREEAGFALETVLLSPRPGALATASLYLPRGEGGPRPAVLVTVGHTDPGKADPEYQRLAQMLVGAGFVTLVLDPLGEGERLEHDEAALNLQPIQGCSGEHDLLDWKCKLLGQSLARYFIRDGLCALHYLAARPEVDPRRIGLTGHSGGGAQACMLMMAAGDQLAAAAPCTYVTDARAMLECGVDPDNEMIWPGSLAAGLDDVDFLAGLAPRPLLILSVQHDFFPREGTLRTLARARRLWQAAGSDALPEISTACSDHAYTLRLAREAAAFFSRHLLGREPAPAAPFSPLPPEALRCTVSGSLVRDFPALRTLQDTLRAALQDVRAQRAALTPDALRDRLAEAVGLLPGADAPEPRVFGEGVCVPYVYRCLAWRPQAGYWNTGVLLRDMRRGEGPLPTVIALWPEGLSRLAEHAPWLHAAVGRGWQVLALDVTASGSLLPAALGRSSLHIGWGTMYKLNAYLMQLGDSLFALRVRQAAAAAAWVRRWPEADRTRLCFYGQGEFSRYAQLAALLTDTPVWADGACQSYGDIVAQRYHDQTHTPAWIFPGALRLFDWPDIQAALQHKGLSAPDPGTHAPETYCQEEEKP